MPAKIDSKLASKVMLAAGLQPLEEYKSSSAKWKCLHIPCGAIVYPRYDKITQGQSGCRACGYKKSSDKRIFSHKSANVLMLKAGFKPLEPYKGAGKAWKCLCLVCEKETSPTFSSVRKGIGCKHCSGNARVDSETAGKVMLAEYQ